MSDPYEILVERGLPCPCGSSDGVARYADGHTHCYVCKRRTEANDAVKGDEGPAPEPAGRGLKETKVVPVTTIYQSAPHRNLSREAIAKYQIDMVQNHDRIEARYPYFRNGQHVANKVRGKPYTNEKGKAVKPFYWQANSREDINNAELFGQSLFPAGSAKYITVVEGEYDAPAAWTLLGSKYPAVSVCSAGSALDDCRRNYEYLDSFENIVICFDKDTAKVGADGKLFYPGQEAARRVAELFRPGKCRILTLQRGKDPNDYLLAGLTGKDFHDEWWKAQPFMPDELVMGSSLLDDMLSEDNYFTVEYPFEGLNRLLYGLRTSELVTITADPKVGKTSVIRKFSYNILMHPDVREKNYGLGLMMLEESKKDTGLGFLSIHLNKPLHLPDCTKDVDEITEAFHEVLDTERIVLWDHFGSNAIDTVINKIRHMVAMGCRYIILDHVSILVSDQSGDERKQLDEIATKLKTLTMELDICIICVIHQNRVGQIRGTMGFEQLSNIVIKLHRDKLDNDEWRRNVTKVVVQENRFCGRTGPACWLHYDERTASLAELDAELIERYENGGSIRDDEVAF